jgi:hypothetical protein
VAFAATAVIGATWRQDIVHHGARLMDFKLQAIVLVVLAAVALGPVVFLSSAWRRCAEREFWNIGIAVQPAAVLIPALPGAVAQIPVAAVLCDLLRAVR